jgi:hypothetical protein
MVLEEMIVKILVAVADQHLQVVILVMVVMANT